jgi:glycerate-2-kinase
LGGPGNDFQFIASGPTVKDATTVRDAGEVLSKYHVLETCGIKDCGLVETPKENKYFARTRNIPALSNETALNAMAAMAKELGFSAEIRAAALTGEARDVGAKIIRDLRAAPPKSVLLYGGETTVTIRGKGRGGRNLELALAGLKEIGDGELVVSVASDGRDNSDFAGAICDTITKEAIRKAGFDAETELKNNNSYPVFEKAGNYLLTGDTGSNVSDLIIALEA